jgi:dihydrofolate reductase
MITGIMATTHEGVIGYKGGLPWNYEDELEHFRVTTDNHVIIMGRKTYDGLPKGLLSTRKAIVFSRNPDFNPADAEAVRSLEEFVDKEYCASLRATAWERGNPALIDKKWIAAHLAAPRNDESFLIGGAEIAHLFLENNLLSSFILTKIHRPYKGDTYLNLNYFKDWDEKLLESNPNYSIRLLSKTNNKRYNEIS